MTTIGELLRGARARGGRSQGAIARELGISRPSVSAWESDGATPRVDRLGAVVTAYQLNDDERTELRGLLGL